MESAKALNSSPQCEEVEEEDEGWEMVDLEEASRRLSADEYLSLFATIGLADWFFMSFYNGRASQFGESESDLGWIGLMMEDIYYALAKDENNIIPTADGLERLGFSEETALTYGNFIDRSSFKSSETLLGWALLKVTSSGLFDLLSGNFNTPQSLVLPRSPNSSQSLRDQRNNLGKEVSKAFLKRNNSRELAQTTTTLAVSARIMKVPGGYSLWFHGTTSQSVNYIMKDGIILDQGREKRDFSTSVKKGFYVFNKATTATSYCQERFECPYSVIIFQLRDDIIDASRNGLDVRFDYNPGLEDGAPYEEAVTVGERWKLEEWQKVIRHYRRRWFRRESSIDSKDFIVGPVSDDVDSPRLRKPPNDGFQLCIRTRDLADEMFQSIVGVYHFT